MCVFRIFNGAANEIKRWVADEFHAAEISVGRSSSCTVSLKGSAGIDNTVARCHFTLTRHEQFWHITDKSTSVGLYKDGHRLSGAALSIGDVIKFGSCYLVVGDNFDPVLYDIFWETGLGAHGKAPLWPGVNVVGNSSRNTVCIRDGTCSKQHALITVSPHGVVIADAGSSNGTVVEGKQLHNAEAPLTPGMTFTLGNVSARIVARDKAANMPTPARTISLLLVWIVAAVLVFVVFLLLGLLFS